MDKNQLRAYAKQYGLTLSEARDKIRKDLSEANSATPLSVGNLGGMVDTGTEYFLRISQADMPTGFGLMAVAPNGMALADTVKNESLVSTAISNKIAKHRHHSPL